MKRKYDNKSDAATSSRGQSGDSPARAQQGASNTLTPRTAVSDPPGVIVISDDDEDDHRTQPQQRTSNTPAPRRRRPPASAGVASSSSPSTAKPRSTQAPDTPTTPPQRKVQKRTQRSPSTKQPEEKRLRQFRKHAPQSFMVRLERATTQRLFVLDRTQGGTDETPEQTFKIAGSTGNIYTVKVTREPDCNCPDALKGNMCKHIVYILHNVLKTPAHLEYQLAFLSSELREMFANAPSFPTTDLSGAKDQDTAPETTRKPVEGDCPICFMELDSSDEEEEIIWCKTCGNNVHASCFKKWAAQSPGAEYGKSVPARCVYCRASWQFDMPSMADMLNSGDVSADGYVNVAPHLGISGVRDTSTYHRRRRNYFWGYDDYDDWY